MSQIKKSTLDILQQVNDIENKWKNLRYDLMKELRDSTQKADYASKPAAILLASKLNIDPSKNVSEPLTSLKEDLEALEAYKEDDNLKNFCNSAKIYLNEDIITQESYKKALSSYSQNNKLNPTDELNLKIQSSGVCHAQEIQLFISQNVQGTAILNRILNIDTLSYAPESNILLLSTPVLDCNDEELTTTSIDKKTIIAGMYRNLFNATLKEGREFIFMSADDLPTNFSKEAIQEYFYQLINVAKEFNELQIFFNPGAYEEDFIPSYTELNEPVNLHKTDLDVVFLADKLSSWGSTSALFIPADPNVVYGKIDVGNCWKTGNSEVYNAQEYIGGYSTAVLGSYGINKAAYQRILTFTTKPANAESTGNLLEENEPKQADYKSEEQKSEEQLKPEHKLEEQKSEKRKREIYKEDYKFEGLKPEHTLNATQVTNQVQSIANEQNSQQTLLDANKPKVNKNVREIDLNMTEAEKEEKNKRKLILALKDVAEKLLTEIATNKRKSKEYDNRLKEADEIVVFLKSTAPSKSIEEIQNTLQPKITTINANAPTWKEKHWLKKLLDILFPLIPLYRHFFTSDKFNNNYKELKNTNDNLKNQIPPKNK